jgi:hypothetical protein
VLSQPDISCANDRLDTADCFRRRRVLDFGWFMRNATHSERPMFQGYDFMVSMVSIIGAENLLGQGIRCTDCAAGIDCKVFYISIL